MVSIEKKDVEHAHVDDGVHADFKLEHVTTVTLSPEEDRRILRKVDKW